MQIPFDVDFDGYPWPGPLKAAAATFGDQWVGPQGLLSLLETQLGLGGLIQPDGLRAAALVPAVVATSGFWSASARVDPMGVANALLEWRDMLWSSGWRGQGLSPRLRELAQMTSGIIPGIPDRIAAVADRLSQANTDLRALELTEPRTGYPHGWQGVLAALESRGTRIVEVTPTAAKPSGDLLAARRQKFKTAADGSLQLLRSQGPQLAAEAVAAWLANANDTKSTVIIGADALLDAALRRHGLPTVGASAGRRDTALLEILPLVIQLGWSPPDPARALELLTLPTSPIPRGIRGRLVGALKEWPAVDSDLWREALAAGLEKIEDTEDRQRVADRLAVLLQPTVAGDRYPAVELKRRISTLINWLQGMKLLSESEEENYQAAIIQCSNFSRMLDLIGLPDFNRPQLQRMLDDATSGVPAQPRFAPQAGLFGVSTPGAIGGVAEKIIWWNFTRESAPKPATLPLSTVEKMALADVGVRLAEPAQIALGLNARWSRPWNFASSQLMLVCPRYGNDGEDQHPHPLWDQVAANASAPAEINKMVVETPLFATEPKRITPPPLAIPQPRREWRLPKGMTVPPRETESPTGAGSLVGCPFQWTLNYAGDIRGGDTATLPTGDQLVGSVAHKILALVLESNPKTPEAAEKQAERLFDVEGPRMAAILFMPGSEKLKQQSRRATAQAARILLNYLRDAKLGVVAVEKNYPGKAFGIEFAGRLDLVVGPPNGVIDLKWSGEKYRKSEMEAGTAYQLASYAYLTRDGKPFPPVAYFIIKSQRMLTTHPAFFGDVLPITGPSEETWKAFERSYQDRQKELRSGLVLAPGERDAKGELILDQSSLQNGKLVLVAPCRFCEFDLLCGHGMKLDASAIAADGESTTGEGL